MTFYGLVMKDDKFKAMVAISVEVVLMRKGGPQYQLVLARLERDYDCKIIDCYHHPEYLRAVLIDVYGKDYPRILESLEAELGEIIDEKEIIEFLGVLNRVK